ncbi:protoporphyrinogen oxidase [Phymastichus coffea]|uniref:protoporphyrinogen oxidase n=1 Tax=Phymastichus coffea TaxID=108790 RepID=UPI00273ACEA3|nr:protoporphyrinogen oxidase [Phymastichus coffea]XP_058807058.1 protoporphyrinogen oxidase [Phymastichus coffea]XP_058807060.1 protoporphyrinogen oxidase [Phymastichus coffea]
MTAILGGGIGGLSAAYYCIENPVLGPIVLYEASKRFGGWIKSIKLPNGAIFEKGPRTIRPAGIAGENTLQLANNLNLNDKIIHIDCRHPAARNRLIYVNNKLHTLPNSLTGLFKKQEPFNRRLISIVWNDLAAGKTSKEDESIYSFVERRLGKDIADYLISPMICGICAGDAKKISVNFLLKSAFELEQKYGSLTKGMVMEFMKRKKVKKNKENILTILAKRAKEEKWSVWGLKDGLEVLPRELKNYLDSKSNVKLNLDTKCEQIIFKSNQVELLINGRTEKFAKVISSLSTKSLAPLLHKQHPQLSRELAAIPLSTVAVVNFQYPGNLLPMEAFGFLVPPNQNLPILGVIFDSCVFKNSDTVLTVIMGGAWFDKYFSKNNSEEYLLSVAMNQIKNILNIKEKPIEYNVAILNDCIPQYIVGHRQRIQRIENYISAHRIPLYLCGASYYGVGLNDVILSAKQAISHCLKL